MKPISQLTLNRPQPQPVRDPSNFAHWVRKTSELIGRSYIQTAKLVQDWPEHKIERRYKEAMTTGS